MLSFNNEPVILDLRRESINEWRPKNVMKNVKITTPPNATNFSLIGQIHLPVVHMIDNYNFTNFHWIQMKNKKVFLMTHLTDGPSVKNRWIRPYIYTKSVCDTTKSLKEKPMHSVAGC